MTFWTFLRMQRARQDPVGDLARDALQDPTWPRRARTYGALEGYLLSVDGSSGALRACERAFDEWTRTNDTGEDA